ncbi:MAG TPA: hypothetical protein VHE30_10180 [Polyangiaceae bacterium]|nr:hypothetical protein [Polyangiaceae bacterium]
MMRSKAAFFVVVALSPGACRRAEPAPGLGPVKLERGDVVVVERAAAEFFQGRVLSVTDTTLKVQTSEDGEPVVVARSDAYRVPPSAHAFSANEPAICATKAGHWEPCKAKGMDGGDVVVDLDTGEERHLPSNAVIAPSAVTALDIERHFETVEARLRFASEAKNAGVPPRPSGWLPEKREPVIARHGAEWYSAHVAEALPDSGVRVIWDGEERTEALSLDQVVPAPPVSRAPVRGEFALSRPRSPAEPWERVKIEAIGPSEAVAVGIDGSRRRLDVRNLVPLVVAPPK